MKKALVSFKDYNGYKNVRFVIDPDKVEWRKSLNKDPEAITVIAMVDVKKRQFVFEKETYDVYRDGSVKVQQV
jgi:hypothetical protein